MTQMRVTEPIAALQWGSFLADHGPETTRFAIEYWLQCFKDLLHQAEHTAVVNRVLIGRTGRVVLQVLALDPDAAVLRAYQLGDEEGPEVKPL